MTKEGSERRYYQPGGDSYLITPNGEELRTDWGYAMEGIQLIHDWAERRTDGSD